MQMSKRAADTAVTSFDKFQLTLGSDEQLSSTRSVGVNLAQPFKAANFQASVRVAKRRLKQAELNRRYATRASKNLSPALKRRAKLILTLRVEDIWSDLSSLLQRYLG